MKFAPYILILLCLFSCKEKEKAPISREKFTKILIDIHTAKAYSSVVDGKVLDDDDSPSIYSSIFEKYNIDTTVFDSCIMYYTRHVDIYSEIYEKVIDSLNKNKSKYELILAGFRKRDTINIWTGRDSISLKRDSIMTYQDSVLFKEYGAYSLTLDIKIGKTDKSINNRVVGYYKLEQDSILAFDTIFIRQDTTWNHYAVYLRTDTLKYKSLHFRFMDCDNLDSLKSRDVKIKNIELYNPREVAIKRKKPKVYDMEILERANINKKKTSRFKRLSSEKANFHKLK
jgi:hypothetical protein